VKDSVSENSKIPVWRFFGIPRSGNHAIIEWFLRNLNSEKTIFLNNCGPEDPFTTFSYCNFTHEGILRKHRGNIHRDRNQHFDRLMEMRDTASNLVISYETIMPSTAERRKLARLDMSNLQMKHDFSIIRSPLNLMASSLARIRKERTRPVRVKEAVDSFTTNFPNTYLSYLRLKETKTFTAISYEKWGTDADYRADILDKVSVEAVDLSLGNMTSAGGGSSFNRSQDVDTISSSNRWGKFVDDADFQRMAISLRDADTKNLIKSRFPEDAAELLAF
jgi:hypothetical protein